MNVFLRVCIVFILISPAVIIAQQLENPGFELWENAGTVRDEPVDWSSIKTSDAGDLINNAAPLVWDKSTDAHSGNFSLKLINKEAFGIVATGTMTNGRVHADFNPELGFVYTDSSDARWHTPFTWRPDSLAGWYKYYPKGQDFGRVKMVLHIGEGQIPENGTFPNWVGLADFIMEPGVTIDTWTRFCVPFEYYNENFPEYTLLTIYGGNGTTSTDSSIVYFDDLEVIYKNAGIPETAMNKAFLHFSQGMLILDFLTPDYYINQPFKLVDISGRVVYSENLTSKEISGLPANLPDGMYVAVLNSSKGTFVQKIFLY